MISLEKLRSRLPHGGRSRRAKAFADAAFPGCAAHRAEAFATFQVLERLAGRRLDRVELDAPLSQVLPGQSAIGALTLEEIVRELAFAAMVERGLADSDAGRSISHEEMGRRIKTWRK